jgi:heme/copper-type cytochrome/quinol oxidase subunit 2
LGIIGCIVVPSVYLLYSSEVSINPSITIKVIGHQWYWTYEYTFVSAVVESFDSLIEDFRDLNRKGVKRLMDVDLLGVIPSNILVRFLLTSSDVLHSYSIPELGIKMDAVPGRLNQFMVLTSRLGIFYGQCSELCGVSHGFMPISVQSVPYNEFFNVINDIEPIRPNRSNVGNSLGSELPSVASNEVSNIVVITEGVPVVVDSVIESTSEPVRRFSGEDIQGVFNEFLRDLIRVLTELEDLLDKPITDEATLRDELIDLTERQQEAVMKMLTFLASAPEFTDNLKGFMKSLIDLLECLEEQNELLNKGLPLKFLDKTLCVEIFREEFKELILKNK